MIKTPSVSVFTLRRQAAFISLVVGCAMLVMRMSTYFLTHSAAIFSDALESVVHVAATEMAFSSVVLSARPADDSHPYGHGKIEFFSAASREDLSSLLPVRLFVKRSKE